MARVTIGTEAKQILPPNSKRTGWEFQFVPSSIELGNTGLLYLGVNKIPRASLDGANYDHVLNPGAGIERQLADGDSMVDVQGAVWAISDAAAQLCNIRESVDPTL